MWLPVPASYLSSPSLPHPGRSLPTLGTELTISLWDLPQRVSTPLRGAKYFLWQNWGICRATVEGEQRRQAKVESHSVCTMHCQNMTGCRKALSLSYSGYRPLQYPFPYRVSHMKGRKESKVSGRKERRNREDGQLDANTRPFDHSCMHSTVLSQNTVGS